ncbi:MAG: hypothetical protein M1826_005968 [Phylliscum demangeonii]|nr:MAG: hypothetical protein M1826_005968 [Phylliscum demangeonii]
MAAAADAIKVFLTQREPRQITFLFRNREALSQDFAQLADCLDVELRADPLASWHATHPSRVYIQYGQVPCPEDRPAPRYISQLAFTNFGKYVTVLGFAAIQEHEAEEKAQSSLRDVTVGAHFITIPGAAEHRYFGFLDLQMLQGCVTTGDNMKISFGIAGDPEELEWSAYVTESLPVTPNGATTVSLCRPRVTDNQGVYVYRDDRTALRATVTSFAVRRQIMALTALQDGRSKLHQEYRELLIGRHLSLQTNKDLYEGISDPGLPAYLQSLPLSASQQRGLAYFRAISHGVGLIQGPPGTGKTHLICQSMLPLLRFPTTAGRTQKVLVLSPSNDPVNDLTATLTSAITAAGLTKRVVRLHTWSTEEELVKSRSQQDHPREQINRMIDDLEPAIAAIEAAAYLIERFRAIITTC